MIYDKDILVDYTCDDCHHMGSCGECGLWMFEQENDYFDSLYSEYEIDQSEEEPIYRDEFTEWLPRRCKHFGLIQPIGYGV